MRSRDGWLSDCVPVYIHVRVHVRVHVHVHVLGVASAAVQVKLPVLGRDDVVFASKSDPNQQ